MEVPTAFFLLNSRFFTYLFTDKNLKPTTIAGYRTAIADRLGSIGVEFSQSYELNRLIASFHRGRLMKGRALGTYLWYF